MTTSPDRITALSAPEVDAIEAAIALLPDRPSAAIEALQIVQEQRGWVSDESLRALAALLEIPAAELDSIASFYNLIFRRPVGRHVIFVCDSVSCYVMGCDALRAELEQHLGVATGATTADGRFTLLPIVCLGACDRAPVVMVDDALIGNVEVEHFDDILQRFE